MELYIFVFFALGLILYFLSVRRFRKNFGIEILFFLVAGAVSLFFLFGAQAFSFEYYSSLFAPEQNTVETSPTNTSLPQAVPVTPILNPDTLSGTVPNAINHPPQITITYPFDGQVFPANTSEITVTANVTDDSDPVPIVEGLGTISLQKGFNPIIVTAVDSEGLASYQFVVVERQ